MEVEAWDSSGYDQVLLHVYFSFRPPNFGVHLSPLPQGLFPVCNIEDFAGVLRAEVLGLSWYGSHDLSTAMSSLQYCASGQPDSSAAGEALPVMTTIHPRLRIHEI